MSETFSELVDRELPTFNVAVGKESAGGTRGGSIGAGFENLILVTNRAYENKGLGCIKKNQLQNKFIPGGRMCYTMKSTVDYDGYLTGLGFIAFDAKTTKEAVWRPERAKLHQYLYLLRLSRQLPRSSGRGFYLIEFRSVNDAWGTLRDVSNVYLVQDLEKLKELGKYERDEKDVVASGVSGVLFDYRQKLIETL